MQTNYLITNTQLLAKETVDILIENGTITKIVPTNTEKINISNIKNLQTINGTGLIALPGLVDLHTHLREPGQETTETIESASKAAALGGYTAVHAMANTNPVADNTPIVEHVNNLGIAAAWVDVQVIGAVTTGLAGKKLANLGSMAASKAKVKIFSDDGNCVSDPNIMRKALEYVKTFNGVIAQHAQDPSLTKDAQMHEGEVCANLGLTPWPAIAEEIIIGRDILIAQYVSSRLHICHVSTAGSVEIIRAAKQRGIPVTAEVTPHHLALTDENVYSYDPIFKVNPPLRSQKDVAALKTAIADGTIDAIATDHAPHASNTKEGTWEQATMGMVGLETALSVVQKTLVDTKIVSWEKVSEIMSKNPAKIGGLSTQGNDLVPGSAANITLYNPNKTWIVEVANMASGGKNSPFKNMQLPGKVMATFYQGHPTVLNGKLQTPKKSFS